MTNIDPLTYIKTALAREYQAQIYRQQKPKPIHESLVITLSRDYGALGELVAEGLGQALGIPVYDKEVLALLAEKAKADPLSFQSFDEQSTEGIKSFFYSLVSGNAATLPEYRRHLIESLIELARKDCIIIGRGAHLILHGQKVLRVRVVGTKAVCAQRIAVESNIPLAEAEKRVLEINHKRNQAVVDMYAETIKHCSLEHADTFDLVINTDHLTVDAVKDLILVAVRQLGHIPKGATQQV